MDWMRDNYELEWLAAEVNFFLGLLGLAAMVGIRANFPQLNCRKLANGQFSRADNSGYVAIQHVV